MSNVFTEYLLADLDRVQRIDPPHGRRSKLAKNPNGLGVKGTVPHEQPQHRPLRPQDLKHPPQDQKGGKLPFRKLYPRGQADRLRQQLPLHQPQTILNGHTGVHASRDPELHPLSEQDGL